MDLGKLLAIAIGAILINNFVLARFLGLCPFLGVSKQLDSAVGMGFAVIFVMTMASMVCFGVYQYVLTPLHIQYLRTIAFILVIAALVQFVEMVLEKSSPGLYKALGIYLPLITTNCAVLGVAVLNVDKSYGFIQTTVHGFAGGLGFMVAMILMAGLRERIELGPIPESLKGFPIAFIMTGLMALAFLGFAGLITE
ncbi:MAG: electron transport complex subunit RsxA [Candidatus Eisenbacteria bacterium]